MENTIFTMGSLVMTMTRWDSSGGMQLILLEVNFDWDFLNLFYFTHMRQLIYSIFFHVSVELIVNQFNFRQIIKERLNFQKSHCYIYISLFTP